MVGLNVLTTERKSVARLKCKPACAPTPAGNRECPEELKVISASRRYQPKRVPLYAVVGLTVASELVLSTMACTCLPIAALVTC